jgi:hypothetical protein
VGGHLGNRNTSAHHLNISTFGSHRDNGADRLSVQPLMFADVDDASQDDAYRHDTAQIDTNEDILTITNSEECHLRFGNPLNGQGRTPSALFLHPAPCSPLGDSPKSRGVSIPRCEWRLQDPLRIQGCCAPR